ncbi:shikimate dehydrogenase [Ruminococcus sp. YRD2003]|uniref:shikimate dehydrogenase family protein n=1 Tax=Ruminococcus sp. YRD2003 TaxID=1452313 RepID=UPI0008AAEEB7|nr:shikimate dehydrogenase [Ruminococcus flavefaciens]
MDKYGLIGHPLGHSMSPLIHEKLFALSGISDYSYELIDIAPADLETRMEELRQLRGFNITIPHKTAVIPFADELSESALRYNSVNCISNNGGKFVGYNTDCDGFLRSAECLPLGGKVLLVGCGGVGRMIAIEAALHGAELTIAVIPQDIRNAQLVMAEILAKCSGANVRICLVDDIEGGFDLLINATPVGMFPKTENCAVSDNVIADCGSFFDVIYNPTETLLMRKARALGKVAVGGASMLVYQAVKAHEYWYGGEFSAEDISKIIVDVEEHVNAMNN